MTITWQPPPPSLLPCRLLTCLLADADALFCAYAACVAMPAGDAVDLVLERPHSRQQVDDVIALVHELYEGTAAAGLCY
jgi:hypothetical protein